MLSERHEQIINDILDEFQASIEGEYYDANLDESQAIEMINAFKQKVNKLTIKSFPSLYYDN